MTLDFSSSGQIFAKSQVTDYSCRGDALSDYNVLDFFVDTYEEEIRYNKHTIIDNGNDIRTSSASSDLPLAEHHITRGRPPNLRVQYHPQHPKASRVQRVCRSEGHRNLPNIIGRYFPRRDDAQSYQFYCACMLMLLKPWRDIHFDLKEPSETWSSAFDKFLTLSPNSERLKFILSGIQYFHDCESAAAQNRYEDSEETHSNIYHGSIGHELKALDDLELGEENTVDSEEEFTEEGLAERIAAQVSLSEELHAMVAVEVARHTRIFSNTLSSTWDIDHAHPIGNASGDDLRKLLLWKQQMKADVLRRNSSADPPQYDNSSGSVTALSLNTAKSPSDDQTAASVTPLQPEASLSAIDPSELNTDQSRAYDIIVWHLEQTLANREPPPLRMLLCGSGGTGKSKVIQTATAAFEDRAAVYMLIKSAYTGIAASIVDGKTTHHIGHFSLNSSATLSDEAKAILQTFWKFRRYLIIDEFSMIAKTFLSLLSRNIGIGVEGTPQCRPDESFGGINVIMCGDLHQFPPVATSISEALYRPINMISDSVECQLGRKIYEEFRTVVILKEQKRVTDEVWKDFLDHLRCGQVQEHHIKMLKKLVIGNPDSGDVDFHAEPWRSAPLVTPRHAVRKRWNEAAVRKWCEESGQRLFVCTAEDTIKGRVLTLREKYALADRGKTEKRRKRKDLPMKVELAVGMKVMVTDNLETDLDVANGARGEIVDIILDPDEPPIGDDPIVHLQKLPSYVLVKLTRTRATRLEGLDEAVIPVEMTTTSMRITMRTTGGKSITHTVQRRQYPMTAAYAFTDYRSQGQTIPYVIVDIAPVPHGRLSLFNLYVALSRSSGRDTIRLLRDFDENDFKQAHDPHLLIEDDRLEELNRITSIWWERMRRSREDSGESKN